MNNQIVLNNGLFLIIRDADIADAANVVSLMRQLTYETENLVYGKGDYSMSIDEEENYIERVKASNNSVFIIALLENELVGYIALAGESKPKISHNGTLSMGILKAYWGMGIGNKLMSKLIDWVRDSKKISKINLYVRADNESAIHLYKKAGFIEEGKITRDFKINGVYYDSYLMGLCID